MEVIVQPTEELAVRLAARLVEEQVGQKPDSVLGLATGRTMEALYAELVRLHAAGRIDFSQCRTFNLDEYVGLGPEDDRSYRAYMRRHFFDAVNLDIRNTHLPDGSAADLGAACRAYEDAIRDCGGIDLQILGIGVSGHIGFNEPLSALRSRTREKALTPVTRRQNAPMFGGDPGCVPVRALTMGVGTILDAGSIVLLATGEAKADVLARAVEGPITSMISATAIQLHPRVRVIVDAAAASRLEGLEYYRWIYENEPEWQPHREALAAR
jgi:glucosamine-6-phosphate deaminase